MTAILGMNYLDGVLMLADTEETTSSATKSECDKLYRFTFPIGTVITGGAGDASLIEYANQEMHQFFARSEGQRPDSKWQPEDILAALKTFGKRFFRETIGEYKGFEASLVPSFAMLVAVNYEKRSYLFRWEDNRVAYVPSPLHDSIGSGMIQLHPMLRDAQFAASKETMLFLGVRMMFHAKRIVQGVGGRTEAIALENGGGTHYFGLDATQKAEELVINLEKFLTTFVYTSVSKVFSPAKDLEKNVAQGFAELPRLLHQYREHYREILTPPKPQLEKSDEQPSSGKK
jgi:proteasome subunit B (beta)-like protein